MTAAALANGVSAVGADSVIWVSWLLVAVLRKRRRLMSLVPLPLQELRLTAALGRR